VHHPLIFTGLKRLIEDEGVAMLVRRLVREERSLLAAHTNLDSAPAGLNHAVGALLGLTHLRPLVPSEAHLLYKLVVYVPESAVESVRDAICTAGAGHIGKYDQCTFAAAGTGTFRPGEGTRPFSGTPGVLAQVAEIRLETVVPRPQLRSVLHALHTNHPYEEIAYDLLPLENAWPGAGLGCLGVLPAPLTAGDFFTHVRKTLPAPRAGFIGDCNQPIRTVALCTGAGGDFLEHARRAGADLYLSGEIKHHQALLARQYGLAVIDAGHFPTERPAVPLLATHLRTAFPDLQIVEADEADPFQTMAILPNTPDFGSITLG